MCDIIITCLQHDPDIICNKPQSFVLLQAKFKIEASPAYQARGILAKFR